MKILLENMEDKEEVMERLYQEGPAKLPPIQDDFVCKMISCRAESDPEVESKIPGLASYKAMGISLAAFANLQLNDDYCQDIRETMGNKSMKWLFAEIDGILVRLPPSIHSKKGLKARLTPNTPRAVVPDVLIDLLIDRVHCGLSRAHVGASRVLATVTKKSVFKMMKERVQARIAACLPCQLSMYTTRTAQELHPTLLELVPRRSVAIDLAVDFPKCMGWVHIMVFVDLATNFVTLKPLKSKTSKELTERFGEYMAAYGFPSLVRHDQEKGLTGGAFKELCEELGIEQVLGLPNKPQTNGRVEAQVRNVNYALKSLTLAQGSNGKWPKELWKVQLALNTSVSQLMHGTPELMMFGHEAEKNCYDLVSLTSVEARYIWEAILPESSHSLDVRNKNKRSNTLEVGNLVWRQIMQPVLARTRHALDSRYVWPFKIVKLHDSSAEIVSLHDSEPVAAHVHLDQLKPYFPWNPVLAPDWDDALDLVLRGQRGVIEEEHVGEQEEEEPEEEKDGEEEQGEEEAESQGQENDHEHAEDFEPPSEAVEASPRDREAGVLPSGVPQEHHEQGKDFGPEEQASTPSPHDASASSQPMDPSLAHHEVIMEEPCDEIMEGMSEHLPDEDIEMVEEIAMEQGEEAVSPRRPKKRSSSAREPVSKRSKSRESYLQDEED